MTKSTITKLKKLTRNAKKMGEVFSSINDVILAYSVNKITLHTPIWLRFDQVSKNKLSNVLNKKQSSIKLLNHNNSMIQIFTIWLITRVHVT